MAEGIDFPGSNCVFYAPADREDIVDLFVFRQPNGPCNISCWRLTPEELEEVNRTGCVFLSVASGRTFLPSFVGSETSVRALAADYGQVWPRAKPKQESEP